MNNHSTFWDYYSKNENNFEFNKDFIYFLDNPFSTEQKIYDVINKVNSSNTNFNYVTNHKNFNALKNISNIIIDSGLEKIILIPHFDCYDNPNYNDLTNFITYNLNDMPTEKFINFINNDLNIIRFI
jgi:hypothetical protein